MFAIRRADLDDSGELGEFFVKAWQVSFVGIVPQASLDKESAVETAARCAELIGNPARLVFVALDNARIVGTTFAVLPEFGVAEGRIKSLFVDHAFHRQGLGSALMARVASEFLARGITSLTLGVFTQNLGARQFYEALGGMATHQSMLEWDGHQLPEMQYHFGNLHALASRNGA